MTLILALELIIALTLIGLVLIQRSGSGLGASFGGSTSYHTKRGLEKGLFAATAITAALFALISVVALIAK